MHFIVGTSRKLETEQIKKRLIYPKHSLYTQNQLNLIEQIWNESFGVLPRAIWATLAWRGEQFEESAVKPTFIFSDSTITTSEYFKSLQGIVKPNLSIDWISLPSYVIISCVEDSIRFIAHKISRSIFHSHRFISGTFIKVIKLLR